MEGEKVTISLPEARMLEASLDEEKTELYDWDSGLLVRDDYSLVEQARREAIGELQEAARDEALVDKAQDSAEESIRGFARSLGYEEVEFT